MNTFRPTNAGTDGSNVVDNRTLYFPSRGTVRTLTVLVPARRAISCRMRAAIPAFTQSLKTQIRPATFIAALLKKNHIPF